MPFETPRLEGGAEDPGQHGGDEPVEMQHDQMHDVQGGPDGGVYDAAEVAAAEESVVAADPTVADAGSLAAAGAREELRLPAGTSNELFSFTEADSLEYTSRPRTAEQFLRHAVHSMRALAVTEHAAFATASEMRDNDTRVFGSVEGQDKKDETEAAVENIAHREDDLMRSVRIPVPETNSHYTQGIIPAESEGEQDEFRQILKIQPIPKLPELSDDEDMDKDVLMELFMKYRAELLSPTEFSWESSKPDVVMISRAESMVPLNELPVDEMIRAVKFLRRVAIWDAMTRDNHAVLERLQPVEEL